MGYWKIKLDCASVCSDARAKSRLAAPPCQSPDHADHADIAWSEQCSDFMHNLSGRFFGQGSRMYAMLKCSWKYVWTTSITPYENVVLYWVWFGPYCMFEAVGADTFCNFWLPLTMGRNKMALAGHPRPCETCLLNSLLALEKTRIKKNL